MPRKTDSSNPSDWIFIAASDLLALSKLAAEELGYSLCVSKLAEVLEKILKAELIRQGWFLERTHDLMVLAKELKDRDVALAETCKPLCIDLAEKYFADRYPGFDLDDEDWPDLRNKITKVQEILNQVKARLGSP